LHCEYYQACVNGCLLCLAFTNRLFPVVVDVSAQISCTVIPTSPDGLDTTGGIIVDGTANVMIECRCVDENGDPLRRIRWFNPNNIRLLNRPNTPVGDPYFIPMDTHVILVIPTFSNSTSGVYTCGTGINYPPPNDVTINLMLQTGKSVCSSCWKYNVGSMIL